jgi:hypothetical protein
MMSTRLTPEQIEDSRSDISPYDVPRILWEFVEEYFESNYGVDFTSSFPTQPVSRPTVVWAVIKRTPGGGKDQKAQAAGRSFTQFLEADNRGLIYEEHTARHTILIEYTVYADGAGQTDRLAWDVEQAILQTTGLMQSRFPGYAIVFDQQTPDSSMLWRQQDELVKRSIRFKVDLPVRFTISKKYVKQFRIEADMGPLRTTKTKFIRENTNSTVALADPQGRKIINIAQIYLLNGTTATYEALEFPTDWRLTKNIDQSVNIVWQDDYGRTPDVGDDYFVDYDVVRTTLIDTIQ